MQLEYNSLEEKVQELELLLKVSLRLNATLDLEEAIHLVLDVALDALKAEAGTLWLLTEDGAYLEPLAARGPKANLLKGLKLNRGEGIAGQVTETGEPILVDDVSRDSRWASRFDSSTGFVTRTMLVVPLRGRESFIGCLQIINKENQGMFTSDDLRLALTLCHQSGLLIENCRLYTYEHKFLHSLLKVITAVIDEKNYYTRGHSERVSRYSRQLAEALNLSPQECWLVELAGRIHDIGKIILGDNIIGENNQFDSWKQEQLKRHSALGGQLLNQMEPRSMIRQLWAGTLYHHEKFNGSGYPAGLAGEDIPMVARIIAVANTFDHLTSGQEYAPPLSEEEAFRELERMKNVELDPELVSIFVKRVQKKSEENNNLNAG